MFPVGRYDPTTASTTTTTTGSTKKQKQPKKIEEERQQERRRYDDDESDESTTRPPPSDGRRRRNAAAAADDEKGDYYDYDDAKNKKNNKKRRRLQRFEEQEEEPSPSPSPSSLRVVAPEQIAAARNYFRGSGFGFAGKVLEEEAFDDLDVVDVDVVEGTAAAAEEEEEQDDDGDEGAAGGGGGLAAAAAPAGFLRRRTSSSSGVVPVEEAAEAWKLAPFLVSNLKRVDGGVRTFFPIQQMAVPELIFSSSELPDAHVRTRDVCIAAPTGSGKTLAYCLPILDSLSRQQGLPAVFRGNNNNRALRALVVLPGRDLAAQVYRVFCSYAEGSRLRVGLATGQSSFKEEQASLTTAVGPLEGAEEEEDGYDDDSDGAAARHRLLFEPGNLGLALKGFRDPWISNKDASYRPKQGRSSVDVLVATPGRLVDHLDKTPGFTLQHLRYLVVDECDRLLSQRYHNWIDRVIESANSASVAAHREIAANGNRLPELEEGPDGCSYRIEPITWRRGGTRGDNSTNLFNTNDAFFSAARSTCNPVQLRKILVSATLTRDPRKLASLRLVNPKHFDAHQQFTGARGAEAGSGKIAYALPASLEECTVTCTAEQKPIVLLALLLERIRPKTKTKRVDSTHDNKRIIVVFTASLDSTHRLARLLQLLWISAGYGDATEVCEFSSSLSQTERSNLVSRCNNSMDRSVSVIVCSDGMSRGMDIQSVDTVINYDVPSLAKTYVHRCGRTARAGKTGSAISLLKGGQVKQFEKMRRLIQSPESVRPNIGVNKDLVQGALLRYRRCVQALRDVLRAEESGEFSSREVKELKTFLLDE